MNIGIITVGRSDYGIWRPILKSISAFKKYKCSIIITGSHFSKKFGYSYSEIIKDNYCKRILANIGNLYDKDSPRFSGNIASKISYQLSIILSKHKFDVLLLLGDRFEMATAALTIIPFKIPIIHFHGGSITTGSFDDNFRHAITKLSNFHMVETINHKKRIIQMGENKKNIKVIGAPSLSFLKKFKWLDFNKISKELNISKQKFIILTIHPETNEDKNYNIKLIKNTLKSINKYPGKVIITSPNGDIYNNIILKEYDKFYKQNKNKEKFIFRKHLGHELYFNLLKNCNYVIGNSSSGIIEAASFKKPVVNIGKRQNNRDCGKNVIHCKAEIKDIKIAMKKAEQLFNSKSLKNLKNIYFKGDSSIHFLKFLDKNKIVIKPKFFLDINF